MNLNQFYASNAALNFESNAQMISSYTQMAILYLKNLSGYKDENGNQIKGIFELTGDMAIMDQNAMIDSGEHDRDSHYAQGYSQIAGAIASGLCAVAGYVAASRVQRNSDVENAPVQNGRANVSATKPTTVAMPKGTAEVELDQSAVRAPRTQQKDATVELNQQRQTSSKSATDQTQSEADKKALDTENQKRQDAAANAYRKANSLRDTGFQIGQMFSNLSTGIGSVVAGDAVLKKAYADAAKSGLDNAIQQLGNTYSLFMSIIQQMVSSAQAAKDTQGAIVAVTKN